MFDDRTLLDHLRMLDDPLRLEPFDRALAGLCSDRVVAEIGVGLGPLSLMALQSGARRVYGIEADARTLAFTTELMHAHGFGPDRFVPCRGRSDEIELPEPVDVVVGELIDSVGLGENAAYYLEDARRRWLRPGGRIVPSRIVVEVTLAACEAFVREREFFGETMMRRHGLDYGPVLDLLAAPRRSLTVRADEVASPPVIWQDVDFEAGRGPLPDVELELVASREAWIDGLAFGFRLILDEDVEIDTRPGTPATCWEQGFLPLPRPLSVHPGDAFSVRLQCPETVEPWAAVRATLDLRESVTTGDTAN